MPANYVNNPNPAEEIGAVVPADGADLPVKARALYIGVAGDVTVDSGAVINITFKNVASGTILPVRVTRVRATGTTATSIVALF